MSIARHAMMHDPTFGNSARRIVESHGDRDSTGRRLPVKESAMILEKLGFLLDSASLAVAMSRVTTRRSLCCCC